MRKFRIVIFVALLFSFAVCSAQEVENIEAQENHEAQITVLSERRTDSGILDRNTRVNVERLSPREWVLAMLREAHARGEHLDLTEEDVMRLTVGEIETIIWTQDLVQAARNEVNPHPRTIYTDEEKEADIFEYIMEKGAEHKTLAATLSLMVLGAYPAIRRCMDVVHSETDEEAEQRRDRVASATDVIFEEVEKFDGSKTTSRRYKRNYLSDRASTDDFIATAYEELTFIPPISQMEHLAKEIQDATNNNVPVFNYYGDNCAQWCKDTKAKGNMDEDGEQIMSERTLNRICQAAGARYLSRDNYRPTREELNTSAQERVGLNIEAINDRLQGIIDSREENGLE